jgi:hypothetical protein
MQESVSFRKGLSSMIEQVEIAAQEFLYGCSRMDGPKIKVYNHLEK